MARVFAPLVPAIAFAVSTEAGALEPVHGEWATQGFSAKVKVEECADGELCGRIVWLWTPRDDVGRPIVDANNPDPALRVRTLVGI